MSTSVKFVTRGTATAEGTITVCLRQASGAWLGIPDCNPVLMAEIERRLNAAGDDLVDIAVTDGAIRRIRCVAVRGTVGDAAAAACQRLSGTVRIDLSEASPDAACEVAASTVLGLYRFDRYRTKAAVPSIPDELTVVTLEPAVAQDRFEARRKLVDAVNFARDLTSEPPNVLNPPIFAERMKELTSFGIDIEILDETDMAKLGMGALLAVGQGSAFGSRLVILRWNGGSKDAPPIALIGKGVCFDAGGISIKASENMDQMKWDMGGAAAVAGALRALAARKSPVNVVGILGLVENMPDGMAYRPGDVLKSMSGQTIEIISTDAEGRLVLADAITYCQDRFKPSVILDIATLTSAVDIALGKEMAGYFTNDALVAKHLKDAGIESGDALWELPLIQSYQHLIDSDVADMKNLSERSAGAGAVTAALFIGRFVNSGQKWAHVDIAGVAWRKQSRRGSLPPGATGFGVALLEHFSRTYGTA